MPRAISTQEKQKFLLWFLRHHRLRSPGAYELFEYFLAAPHRLNRLHFVDQVHVPGVSLVISTSCSPNPPFIFRFYGQETRQPQEALAYLLAHPESEIYLTLFFHQKSSSPEYSKVVLPMEYSQLPLPVENQGYAEHWVDEVVYQARTAYLYYLIDRSLEEQDREQFFHLVQLLREHLELGK
ncbi:MAG: YpiB family protein [Limnochordia bacterium]